MPRTEEVLNKGEELVDETLDRVDFEDSIFDDEDGKGSTDLGDEDALVVLVP